MSIHYCKGLREISSHYQTYIFDIWGVVHNGVQLFPGVKECLEKLKEEGKTVCFLSNSPRAGDHHVRFFDALGIGSDLYSFIYTSGDALTDALDQCPVIKKDDPFFFIGDEMLHQSVWQSLPGERVPIIEEASYVLCSSPMPKYEAVLKGALDLNLPMICSNPDRAAIHGEEKVVCAGAIAHEYETMGGAVFYCGKPEPFVYHNILKRLGNDASQVLAIGDGLFTDIKGARGVNLDCVFIHGGLHGLDVSVNELDAWFEEKGIIPTHVMDGVSW